MKFYLTIGIIVLFYSALQCQNKQIYDEKNGKQILIGICTRDAFSDTSFSSWFNIEYDNYVPDSGSTRLLKEKLRDIHVKIVMGSWCSDSQIHVPDFYKLVDETSFPDTCVKIICVDRKKQGMADELHGLNIEKVPTFIFYRYGKEIGRIIETPVKSIEKDLLNFL